MKSKSPFSEKIRIDLVSKKAFLGETEITSVVEILARTKYELQRLNELASAFLETPLEEVVNRLFLEGKLKGHALEVVLSELTPKGKPPEGCLEWLVSAYLQESRDYFRSLEHLEAMCEEIDCLRALIFLRMRDIIPEGEVPELRLQE